MTSPSDVPACPPWLRPAYQTQTADESHPALYIPSEEAGDAAQDFVYFDEREYLKDTIEGWAKRRSRVAAALGLVEPPSEAAQWWQGHDVEKRIAAMVHVTTAGIAAEQTRKAVAAELRAMADEVSPKTDTRGMYFFEIVERLRSRADELDPP